MLEDEQLEGSNVDELKVDTAQIDDTDGDDVDVDAEVEKPLESQEDPIEAQVDTEDKSLNENLEEDSEQSEPAVHKITVEDVPEEEEERNIPEDNDEDEDDEDEEEAEEEEDPGFDNGFAENVAEAVADDFDDDFGDFEESQPQSQPVSESPVSETAANTELPNFTVVSQNELSTLSESELRDLIPDPQAGFSDADKEVFLNSDLKTDIEESITPTSAQLWQKLTELHTRLHGAWSGTRVHKNLAVVLGLPLNLDASLPKVVNQALDLPVKSSNEDIEGLQQVPEWALLSQTTSETLERMSSEDLRQHILLVQNAIEQVALLKDSLENKEMDLCGEKNILEGMVESLLVFSQRNQREKIKASISKTLKR